MANFSDLLKTANATTTSNSVDNGIAVASEIPEIGVMTLEEPYDGLAYSGEETWIEDKVKYRWFNNYIDNDYSIVDDKKNIELNEKQFNITQEENSQFIPFKMPRYYDGIDLVNTTISIHYDRSDNQHGTSEPVNVSYNSEKIQFAWLADRNVTGVAGKVKFEIHATGVIFDSNGNEYPYEWKTKSNENLNVLQSLCGTNCGGTINIDESWVKELVTSVAENVAQQIADAQVGEQVTLAQTSASEAQASAEMAALSAEEAKTNAQNVVNEALQSYATIEYVDSLDISGQLEGLATEKYVDDAVASVDVSEQLQSYVKTTDLQENYYNKTETEQRVSTVLENYATKDDVANAITEADISEKLNDYYKKDETYNKEEIDNALDNVSVDLTGYYAKSETYSKQEIDAVVGTQNSRIDVVETEVKTLGSLVSDVTESDNGIEVHYNNGSSKTVDTRDTTVKVEDVNKSETGLSVVYTDGSTKEIEISSGGGTSTSGSATITRITASSTQCIYGDECPIEFEFSAIDSAGDVVGDGIATWYVGNNKKTTSIVSQGSNSFDIGKYLSVGSNNVKVSVSVDTGGETPTIVTKTWTVNAVNMYVVWNYDDTTVNTSDTVAIRWTPYGNLSKTTHIVIDGTEVTTSETTRSGVEQYVTINKYPHGSHMVELYLTAMVNGVEVRSDSVYHDMIFADVDNTNTIISCSLSNNEMTQYNTMRIPLAFYSPTSLTSNAILAVDGEQVAEWKDVDRTIHYWNYTPSDFGEKKLTITSGNTVKTINIIVSELQIDNEEIQGYAFRLKASDFAGNEALRSWNSNGVTLEFSDNFDWNNGGIKTELDENGNTRQFICVKAGTTATIDYLLFGNDAKVNGKNFKVIFKATNSRDHDAKFLSCMDNGIGIELGANGGTANSGQNTLNVPYRENSYVEFEYDISPVPTETSTDTFRYIQTYLDGVLTSTNIYAADDQFKQSNAQKIVIGSPDCDVNIYMVKAYESYLTRDNHIENFIADAPNAQEMVARYERNNILNDAGEISYEKLAKKNPNARIHLWSIPRMTEGKKDYVTGCSYQQIYNAGDARHQLTAYNVIMNIQGTSSVDYKDSGANTDGNFTEGFTDGNGNHIDTYSMSDNSIGVNYFNTKVNIASCENINNMCIAEWYDRYQPYVTAYRLKNPKARDCMEHNIGVQFIHDQSHTLFSDDNYHMYAICNMGNSKNNSAVFHDLDNPNECCIETKDNNSTHCMMLDPSFSVEDLDSEDFFEFRYPESPTDEMKNAFIRLVHWFANGNPANATGDALDSEVTFEPYTFKGTGQENEVLAGLIISDYAGTYTNDTYEYRMAKMLSECEDYLIMDSMVYHYVFIEQHAMVDNVCKNTFWGTEDLVHWHLAKNYDNDTADGNNNTGKLVIPFGSEGYDDLDGSPIFNGRNNVYWRFIYGLYEARRVMWTNRETAGAWNAEAYLAFARERQNYLPERVYNQDYWYKYLRLYEQKNVTTYIPMLEGGKKSHQRESFVTNNLYYMASQYMGTACISKSITLRGYTPSEWSGVKPEAKVTVMLYNKGYIVVQIGSIFKRVKADKGIFYTVDFPESGNMNDTVINIHGANLVQALGDISCLYVGRSDFSPAIKIRSIQIGSIEEGYQNNNLVEVGFGQNKRLEELYIQNCPNIKSTLDLSGCQSLRKLDVRGSGFTGIAFAVGGLIENALLCSPSSLNMRSLYMLTDENLSLESFDNLTQIRLEDCPNIDSLVLINNADKLSIARILGVNWKLQDTSVLNNIYNMDGLNENNIATDQSVLSGTVTVPVIGQYELYKYQQAWSDLTIVPTTTIKQFAVTFKNDDGTVLDVQYVDQFGNAVDPITREENPIATPTKESTISHNYSYAGWDGSLINIIEDRTITATYTESLREYTAQYVSKGVIVKSANGLYGDNIVCDDIPTYTAEEPYAFYLFNRWDKSGFLDNGFDENGVKTINAIFDKFEYSSTAFDGRDLSDLSPVEIYAMKKLGLAQDIVIIGDNYSFSMGSDFDYDDIKSVEIIGENSEFGDEYKSVVEFNGNNYFDTGIQLFDEDKDFILAIDYEYTNATANAVLAQCYQGNGSVGFKLQYNDGVQLKWSSNTSNVANVSEREMLVIRHKKGDTNLTVYSSNLNETEVEISSLASKEFTSTTSLIFGCEKQTSTIFANYASGKIHWAKIWYKDLGEDVCKNLALWTHEKINLMVDKFNGYYLTDNPDGMSSFSLIATNLLERTRQMNATDTNVGGWANSSLNKFLNGRMYNAIPTQVKALMKQVVIWSSVGGGSTSTPSTELSSSNCYITIPALKDMDGINQSGVSNSDPYNSESFSSISLFTTVDSRKMAFDGGDYNDYFLRSTTANYNRYFWRIEKDGSTYSITPANNKCGVLIEISF